MTGLDGGCLLCLSEESGQAEAEWGRQDAGDDLDGPRQQEAVVESIRLCWHQPSTASSLEPTGLVPVPRGAVVERIITRVPVFIGTGIPLFGAVPRDIALKHVGTRQYASGLVQSEYVAAS